MWRDERTDAGCNDINKTVGEQVVKATEPNNRLETGHTHTQTNILYSCHTVHIQEEAEDFYVL